MNTQSELNKLENLSKYNQQVITVKLNKLVNVNDCPVTENKVLNSNSFKKTKTYDMSLVKELDFHKKLVLTKLHSINNEFDSIIKIKNVNKLEKLENMNKVKFHITKDERNKVFWIVLTALFEEEEEKQEEEEEE